MPKLGLKMSTRRPLNREFAWGASGSTRSPRPRITTGASSKNNAQSEPRFTAKQSKASRLSGWPASRFSASNAATALLLPPPSPAPIGMRFSKNNPGPPRLPRRFGEQPRRPQNQISLIARHRRIFAGERKSAFRNPFHPQRIAEPHRSHDRDQIV